MSIKGLEYLGKGNGISIVLYKSYKSVILSWDKPYKFTSLDIVTEDAKNYYINNYHELGVRLIEEVEENIKVEDKKDLEKKSKIEDSKSVKLIKDNFLKLEKDSSINIEEKDLNIILNENLTLNQIKSLCKELDFDYGNKRSKAKIIKELLLSKKSDLLSLIRR